MPNQIFVLLNEEMKGRHLMVDTSSSKTSMDAGAYEV